MYKKFKSILLLVSVIVLAHNASAQKIEKSTLKIMTYNIWNGFNWGKDTTRKNNCIKWIKKQKPDVLALQELCAYNEEELKKDALEWGHSYVQILKTGGYPTALTSNKPITIKECIVKPFWHGLLHCESYGIDFYVVHLSPSDCNFRLKEAKLITKRIHQSKNKPYIILGDFNAHSPFDAWYLERNTELKNKLLGHEDSKYSNLRNGEFDYSVISEFLASPAVDICLNQIETENAYTFPTLALKKESDLLSQNVIQDRERIDYILASPEFAKSCINVKIVNKEETHFLSDHYPIIAEFELGKKNSHFISSRKDSDKE